MGTYGDIIADWCTIGLVVSLVLVSIALSGLWLWKLMGPRLRFSLPVVLFLLMAGVATVEAQKAGRGNSPRRLPQVGESVDDAQNRSSGVLQNCESLDYDRFTEINVTTNGVALTLHRPETNALEGVEVTVAGSTNLVAATWEAYTNIVFAAGETNVEVFITREMMAAHSVSNVNFFAFIQSGDSDGDGLDDWHERFNLKTDPYMVDTDGDGIPDGLDHRPLELDWPVLTEDGHLVCWTMWNTNAVPVVGTVGEAYHVANYYSDRVPLLDEATNHNWIIIVGPCTKNVTPSQSDTPNAIQIDPWESGGLRIFPTTKNHGGIIGGEELK